jgi:MoxR-like ATPase
MIKTNILKAALFTPLSGGRWGLPMLCMGEPGVAKTAIIEELAASCGMPCETLSPSERGEGAFGVVPVPGEDGVLHYPRPDWTMQFDAPQRGIVFVDEVTSTPPALQAPLMGLILAKRIGGHILPKGVRVLAAANPTELAAGGYDLAAPVANRFGHINWVSPSVEEHSAYMLAGSSGVGREDEVTLDADAEEKRVLAAWPEAWAKAVGLETSFLARRPGLKNMCPKAGDPLASKGWPSDRSWEAATRALASAEVHGLTETETEEFVEAFIGHGPAGEFFAYMQQQDLPSPVDLLDGKIVFKHVATRLDRTVAVLNACTALITPKTAAKRVARTKAMWALLESMCEAKTDLDILIPAIHALIDAELHAMQEAYKTLAKVQPILKAAGIAPQARR